VLQVKLLFEHPPPVHAMWPCTLKSNEEKLKCVGLSQEIGFAPAYVCAQFVEAGTKAQQSCASAREECNKYDLTAGHCFWLLNHIDWSRWFAISK